MHNCDNLCVRVLKGDKNPLIDMSKETLSIFSSLCGYLQTCYILKSFSNTLLLFLGILVQKTRIYIFGYLLEKRELHLRPALIVSS